MKDINELGAWDSLVNELIDSQLYVVAEDATAAEIKSAVVGTNRPRYYPRPFEGSPASVDCYCPLPASRRVVSVALSRAQTRKEAAPLLEAIAARRGLRVASRVYSTARHWFIECGESTYTAGISKFPAEAR